MHRPSCQHGIDGYANTKGGGELNELCALTDNEVATMLQDHPPMTLLAEDAISQGCWALAVVTKEVHAGLRLKSVEMQAVLGVREPVLADMDAAASALSARTCGRFFSRACGGDATRRFRGLSG